LNFTESEPYDIFCLGTSIAFFYVEAHPITLRKGSESFHFNVGVMNKQVTTIFLFNKPKALLLTEPFYCSFCQSADLLSNIFNHVPKPAVATLAEETILQTKPTPEVRHLTTVAKFKLTFHKGQAKR
jgi:hypothetical protein